VVKVGRYDEKDLVSTAKLLVEQGASITLPINEDFTPLMFASREGSLEMVRFLVENGADVNAETGDGRTPLGLAVEEGHDGVADYLASKGAKK
jgi:ankyrin repeat protein